MSRASFKEVLKKPSAAVRAMIQGLDAALIEIDMTVFSENDLREPLEDNYLLLDSKSEIPKEICFGCCAAVTTLEVFPNRKKDYSNLYHETDLGIFEIAIDSFRRVEFLPLLNYFDVPLKIFEELDREFGSKTKILTTRHWPNRIFRFKEIAKFLEERGY